MRYAIVGSRTWTNREQFEKILIEEVILFSDDPILTGSCPTGVDALVREEFPRAQVYAADWSQGRKAGPLRNARLVADADVVYVFRSAGRSPGSDDVIRHALRLRKELHVYHEHAEGETK